MSQSMSIALLDSGSLSPPGPLTQAGVIYQYIIYCKIGVKFAKQQILFALAQDVAEPVIPLKDYCTNIIKHPRKYVYNWGSPLEISVWQPSLIVLELDSDSADWGPRAEPNEPAMSVQPINVGDICGLQYASEQVDPAGGSMALISNMSSPPKDPIKMLCFQVPIAPSPAPAVILWPFDLNIFCNNGSQKPVKLVIDPDIKNEGPPPPPSLRHHHTRNTKAASVS